MSQPRRRLFSFRGPQQLERGPRRRTASPAPRWARAFERLEDRWALSAAPVLSLDQPEPVVADEAATVAVDFKFTDAIEGGGGSFGLNPADYAAQATANGAFTALADVFVDTTAGMLTSGLTTISGVAVSVGSHSVMAFAFDSFTLGAGFTLTAVGNLPLAILSQGDVIIDGTIDLRPQASGLPGLNDNSHVPGAGGGEGGRLLSDPDALTALTGRAAAGAPASSGGGAFGGQGGGGGGYGGNGGSGSGGVSPGLAHGDLLNGVVHGGSGAGAGGTFIAGVSPEGGDGGGGIEIAALGDVTVGASGSILADGLDGEYGVGNLGGGGGGAGGGILIHGQDVSIDGTLSATGGDGANVVNGGGGGGGGRILIAEDVAGSTAAPTIAGGALISVLGGANGSGAGLGASGLAIDNHTYSGAAVAETYSYYIDWGNGEIETGADGDITVVDPGSPGFDTLRTFSGSTVYGDNGSVQVIVRLADSSMSGNFAGVAGVDFVELAFTIDVANVDPTADAGPAGQTFDDMAITLTGSGADVAGALDPLTYTWDLDNDGDFDDAVGASAVFDPAALGISGTQLRTVRMKAADGDGGEAIDETTVQVLGEGALQIGGVLHIVGSATACDIVLITQCAGDIKVYATFNDDNPAVFAAAAVTEIQVRTRGGHDVVVTTSNVVESMTLDGGANNDLLVGGGGSNLLLGGAGRDTLIGGDGADVLLGGVGDDDLFGNDGDDVLVGGDGADMLFGGDGRDVLIGSHDSDLLNGGTGDDILIGGFTVHDENLIALDAIMAIWSSSNSFNARVAALTGSGGLLEAGATVFDDNAADHIVGGAGRDLAFADMSRSFDGVRDTTSLSSSQDTLVALN